jgi:YHS domain-containing protein
MRLLLSVLFTRMDPAMLSRYALRLGTVVGLSIVACLPAVTLAQTPGVAWRNNFDQAKVEAAQTGRLVLLHFTTKKCAPCRVLDQTVFNQPQVGPAIEQNFVPVRVDADDNQALAMNFRIDRVPTEIILTPEGKVLANPPIPDKPDPYLAQLQNIANHFRQAPPAAAQPAGPAHLNNAYANLPVAAAAQAAAPAAQVASNSAAASQPGQAQSQGNPYAAAAPRAQANPFTTAPPQASPANPYASTPPAPVNANAAMPDTARYGSAANVYAAAPAQQQGQPAAQSQGAQSAPPAASNAAVAGSNMPSNAMPRSYSSTEPGVSAAAVAAAAPVAASTIPGGIPANGQGSPVGASVGIASAAGAAIAAQASAKRQPPELPAGSPPLAFDGYCPVTLKTLNHWSPGDGQFGAVHRGRTYLFAGAEQRDQFLASPDAYSPVFAGLDPVMLIDKQQSVEGKRALGFRYGDSFYLFSSEETKQKFAEAPHMYAAGVRQAMSRIDSAEGGTVRR